MNRILLITILACLTTASPAKAQSSYNELVEEAMKYIKLDSLTQAENLFRQALKADPTNARNALVFSNLGTVLKRQGKTDEAIKNYTFALNITPYEELQEFVTQELKKNFKQENTYEQSDDALGE